ncbi:MAG: DUF5706 domain-containing protein [Rhodospirillaceae bacterium]|nr:DUF5706 domain-containing protein [Rhodospirillaceae bacterium]
MRSHYESLSRVIQFTRTADRKAAPILALQVALLGALATRFDRLLSIIGGSSSDAERVALVIALGAFIVCLFTAFGLAAAVYVPRNSRTGKSYVFFEDIAAMEHSEFESAARNLSSDVIERQLIDQIYRVSRVASFKMKRVRWAIRSSVPAVALGLILLAWSSF